MTKFCFFWNLKKSRACDGCLNFQGMFDEIPSANKASHVYKFDPPTNTNNQHLGLAAVALERIYKTIDWPFAAPQGDINKAWMTEPTI